MINSKKARIAVFVSGGGTNLQALIDAEKSGIIKHGKIVLVVSNKEQVYALERAENAGIKTAVVAKKDCKNRGEFEAKLIRILEANYIDVIVLAGFMVLLSADFVGLYPERILNVHPSLIPKHCGEGFFGLKVHESVLASGDTVTGATVHFVNEIADGGQILAQKEVSVRKDDTPEILQKRVMEEAEWIILPETVEKVAAEVVNNNNRR